MPIQSFNPTTEHCEREFAYDDAQAVERKLALSATAFNEWRALSFSDRASFLNSVAALLEERKELFADIMAREVGKPISTGRNEIVKCASVCRYYAEHAESLLAQEVVQSDFAKSYVRFDPLGCVLAIMPWNYPFWQVFRFAAPALMSGNVGMLKHASNVPQCAEAIEQVFLDAGCPKGIFQHISIPSSDVAALIADDRIVAVTLTGSEEAGSSVACAAGKAIKKSILELGGSDPFIVLPDCDLSQAALTGATARLQNCGQTCIAPKRFIVHADVADEFASLLKKQFEEFVVGDPLLPETQMGPLASRSLLLELERQVTESVRLGARVITGGARMARTGFFFEPTILSHVVPGMPAYDEEFFGPVAAMISAKDEDEIIAIANDTRYGLGASIWTKDIKKAETLAGRIDAGVIAINSMVKSDPRLPFGGIKKSGYGRELAQYGLREFLNIKTVLVSD